MLAAIITDIIITYHSSIDTAKTPETNWTNGVVVSDMTVGMISYFHKML